MPSDAEIGVWEQRVRDSASLRLSLPTFKNGYCYVTLHMDGRRTLVRVPEGTSLDQAEVIVAPGAFERRGEESKLRLQSWQFLTDDILAFFLADETENGVLRFLDVNRGTTVGREIENFRWGALAQAGDALYYTVHHPGPLTPGPAEWRVRTGGLDGPDTTIPNPGRSTGSEPAPWPSFTIHEDNGHQWLVAVGGQAQELRHLYLADLSAPAASPEHPRFTSSLVTTMRGSLAVREGTATFVSTDMGRFPQGALFRAPIGSLTDRGSWKRLIPVSHTPGAHLNSVRWVGTRLVVHRTQDGSDALDVRAANGKFLYAITGPPEGRTGAMYGITAGTPGRDAHGASPNMYVSWGDLVGSRVYEYRLGDAGPTVRPWPPAQEAAARVPHGVETVTRVWRAQYANGKVATARLTMASGTDPSRSIGTVVEQFSHFATPQAPAAGYGGPPQYALPWIQSGGGVLAVMLENPVVSSTEHEAALGITAVLESGIAAGLLTSEKTVLSGTSAAAVNVALMLQEHPSLFRLGVTQHGVLSRGEQAAQVGVGPNNAHDWSLGPASAAARHGGVERLAAYGLSAEEIPRRALFYFGRDDTRVPGQFHSVRYAELIRQHGAETLVVEEQGAGHLYLGTDDGAARQSGIFLAVIARELAGARRHPASRPARSAAEVALRHEPANPIPPTPDARLAAKGFRKIDVSRLTSRTPLVAVEQWRSSARTATTSLPQREVRQRQQLEHALRK
ncbi:prolyl oligopeptidase family serine peptidase [Yinghuangia sp. ASG 101]|uniref:alpha/beta hydrolase family protein n=1 Tax=Yinghuangia sp. ASG 101 TaxID=2896848 RepID=UPI001E5CC47A|nr:prolyl oligopeptidase family serine peptidase [Yinghuangia sp. ASG 101]UGQ11644.1 prolyl oligopeptidase family serine peptidase [Yinghuangia sp. ASG 101]